MRALAAVVGVTRRQVETPARVVGFAALGLVGVLVAWRVGVADPIRPDRAAVRFADTFSLGVLAPLVAVVFGTAALGDPRDDGTLVYLWARPRPRRTLALGALGAALVPVLPLSVVPAAASAALVGATGATVAAVAIATTAVAISQTAVFVSLGMVTSRALMWGVGYVLIFENFVARGGKALGGLSLHAYGASILSSDTGEAVRLAYFSAGTAWVVLGAVTVAATVLAIGRLRSADLE